MKRILLIGGAGVFGERLAGRLLRQGHALTLAGRSVERAAAAATRLGAAHPGATIDALRFDRDAPDPALLAGGNVFAIVDAAGPFQANTYALPEVAIAAGLHYIDLADARDFVGGIASLDARARAAGLLIATGASSVPALTSAALDELAADFLAIDRIDVALSPGNRAPRGRSVVEAILSYAGRPVRVFHDGAWRDAPGWGLTRRADLPRVGRRFVSLCDVPDLDIAVTRYRPREAAIFRAGLELPILHLGLLGLTLPVRAGLVRSLRPLAGFLRAAADLLRPLGTDRGGLVVEVAGTGHDGRPKKARWWLAAESGAGPTVPTLAAAALVRALADGRLTTRGARPCIGLVCLADILREGGDLPITTGFDRPEPEAATLYPRVMGASFETLAEPIRDLHKAGGPTLWRGRARVDAAANPLAATLRRLMRFPPPAADLPVSVSFRREGPTEIWTRDFGGARFSSRLTPDRSSPYRIEERFGPLVFRMRLPLQTHATGKGLAMELDGWRLGPLPLPRRLAPRIAAREKLDEQGRFTFDVEIGLPLAGKLVRYRGWLAPEAGMATAPRDKAISLR